MGNLPAVSNADLAQQLSELNISGLGPGQNPRETSNDAAYAPSGRGLPDLGASLAARQSMGMMGKALQIEKFFTKSWARDRRKAPPTDSILAARNAASRQFISLRCSEIA